MEPKSREMPCSSITRNVRCELVAKKIRKADGNKDYLLFKTSNTVETGQEQLPTEREQCFKIQMLRQFFHRTLPVPMENDKVIKSDIFPQN